MASTFLSRAASDAVVIVRLVVALSYFLLMVLFYTRAPAASNLNSLGVFSRSRPLLTESERYYSNLGPFGELMLTMLGPTDVAPFTVFVPSKAAFLKLSSSFGNISEHGEVDPHSLNENTYAVLSHLLSFSAVPKPIFSKHVPFCQEAVHESLSGFLLSLSRVPGRGLLVNNLTCEATDLRRGSFVIHIVDGVLMDFEFEQSMSQERAPAASEDSDLAGEQGGEQEQKEVPK